MSYENKYNYVINLCQERCLQGPAAGSSSGAGRGVVASAYIQETGPGGRAGEGRLSPAPRRVGSESPAQAVRRGIEEDGVVRFANVLAGTGAAGQALKRQAKTHPFFSRDEISRSVSVPRNERLKHDRELVRYAHVCNPGLLPRRSGPVQGWEEPVTELARKSDLGMRPVSFPVLLRMPHMVALFPDGIAPGKLDAEVKERALLSTRRESAPARATLYHHRNALVHPGALERHGRKLRADSDNPHVRTLLGSPSLEGPRLHPAARDAFSELVVADPDCRRNLAVMSGTHGPIKLGG